MLRVLLALVLRNRMFPVRIFIDNFRILWFPVETYLHHLSRNFIKFSLSFFLNPFTFSTGCDVLNPRHKPNLPSGGSWPNLR